MKVSPLPAEIVGPASVEALALVYKTKRGWEALTGRRWGIKQQRPLFYKQIWSEAAAAVGATIEDLGGSILEIRTGSGTLRVLQNYTSLDDPVTLRIAGDKPLVHRLLQARGLPVPAHRVCRFDDVRSATEFVCTLDGSFVVKPARGTGAGKGITAGVRGCEGLLRALAFAGAYCTEVIIERQVEGGSYRLLYFNGELIDAVLRRPPGVTGDGSSSLRRLIANENRRRRDQGLEAGQTLIKTDWELRQTVKGQGMGPRSVPRAGEKVRLKSVVSDNSRDENERVAGRVCESVIQAGSLAATCLGVRLAGVDVVTSDPLVALEISGGAIIEVNTTPGLHFHYQAGAEGVPVARAILERFISSARPGSPCPGIDCPS